jgi:excisionase family DNA binding protein
MRAIAAGRAGPGHPGGDEGNPMADGRDLAGLLEDPTSISIAEIPAALGALETAKAVLWARLTTAPAPALPPASEADPLTQEEAAIRYRLPLRTVRRLTRTRTVASYQQGRNRMVRPADLDRYLARCRDQGVPVGTRLDAYKA